MAYHASRSARRSVIVAATDFHLLPVNTPHLEHIARKVSYHIGSSSPTRRTRGARRI